MISLEQAKRLLEARLGRGRGKLFSCPYHADKTPSLSLFAGQKDGTPLVKCFSCGLSQSALGLLRALGESIETTDNPIPLPPKPAQGIGVSAKHGIITCLLDHTQCGHRGQSFLERRCLWPLAKQAKITSIDTWADYQRVNQAVQANCHPDDLKQTGLINANGNLKMAPPCLLIPWQVDGQWHGLQIRAIDPKPNQPKIRNGMALPLVYRRPNLGLPEKEPYTLVSCEGVFDALAFEQLHEPGTLPIGLSSAGADIPKLLQEIAKFSPKSILMALDNDFAGKRLESLLSKHMNYPIQALSLGQHNDVNDYLMSQAYDTTHTPRHCRRP